MCRRPAFAPGDRIVFFTDGITERQASDGSMYDEERLAGALVSLGTLAPRAIVDRRSGALDTFARGQEPDDDQTLLVVGIN